jgi:hypothetical protein
MFMRFSVSQCLGGEKLWGARSMPAKKANTSIPVDTVGPFASMIVENLKKGRRPEHPES